MITYFLSPQNNSDDENNQDVIIEISDKTGNVLRKYKGTNKNGINRVTWGLVKNFIKQPGQRSYNEEFPPPGFPVIPGTYTVKVIYGEVSVTKTVDVRTDPRVNYTNEDYRLTYDALTNLEEKISVVTEAIDRIRKVEKIIKTVNEQLEGEEDQSSSDLKTNGNELKKRLKELSAVFIPPEDREGIFDDSECVFSVIQTALGQAGSTWEKPTPAHRTYLRQAEEALQAALEEFNNVFSSDVADYRSKVNSAGIELFPEINTLDINWKKGN
jgi:hypothetical protein